MAVFHHYHTSVKALTLLDIAAILEQNLVLMLNRRRNKFLAFL
jgi:hypothetical protein